MRIHILTQPLGHNYGGNLQAFALQQVLKAMGHDVMTLDRHWNLPRAGGKLLCLRILSSLKATLFTLLGQKRNLCNPFSREYNAILDKKTIRRFVERKLWLSSPLFGTDETADYIRTHPADCYIVGSDQVWRKAYCPSLDDYYLAAVPEDIAKISYAASFGKDDIDEYTQEEIEYVRPLIQRFKSISVREESGISICRDKFGVEATQVLDPTLLLKAEDYLRIIKDSKERFPHHHLGVYMLDESPEKLQFVENASSTLGLRLNVINVHEGKGAYIKYPSVESWLANIAYADYVITDSFHGMVFSIIFNKPFAVIGNTSRGLSRFISLLEALGLGDRMITDIMSDLPSSQIDYETVNKQLDRLRNSSLEWIKNALN